jgi:NADH-quinone oxidoreductase subunit E
MTVRRLAPDSLQPESFAFTPENLSWAKKRMALYPKGKQQSAVLSLLMRAQEQEGWLSRAAIEVVAELIGMAKIRVLEVATFYTQFQLQPVGSRAHVQVCGTVPCLLCGSEKLRAVCKQKIHPEPHRRNAEGTLSWEEVECLGACVNGPVVMIGEDTYEDLTPERLEEIIDAFARGEGDTVPVGSQTGRQFSAPASGPTTLTEIDGAKPARASVRKTKSAAKRKKPAAASEQKAPFAAPEGEADDLKLIAGVGPVLEKKLNDFGVTQYAQIAAFKKADIDRLDTALNFKGRIGRENWVEQAKALAEGGIAGYRKVFKKDPRR